MKGKQNKSFTYFLDEVTEKDKESFEYFYQTLATPIYRFLYLKTGKKEVAEDLMQDTFVKLYKAQKEGSVLTTSKSYIYTIAKNTLTDYYRKKKPVLLDEEMETTIADDTQDIIGVIDLEHEIARLRKSLALLTEEQREVVEMRFMQDMSGREIADILGKKEDAVRQLQARALKTLRAYFNKDMP